MTALRSITQAQFDALGEKAQEVILLDQKHEEAIAAWLDKLRSGENVLSLEAARANPKPKPTAWRGHLTRALAKICSRGGDPTGGGPRTASMGRR